jgi:hypothetical protein
MFRRLVRHLALKLVVELDRERHEHLRAGPTTGDGRRLPFLVALLALSPVESVAADERLFGELVCSGAWTSPFISAYASRRLFLLGCPGCIGSGNNRKPTSPVCYHTRVNSDRSPPRSVCSAKEDHGSWKKLHAVCHHYRDPRNG